MSLLKTTVGLQFPGLLGAVAPRYRYLYSSGIAVAPLLLVEKNGDGSAATFHLFFGATRFRYF